MIETMRGTFDERELALERAWVDDADKIGIVHRYRLPGSDEVIATYATGDTLWKDRSPFDATPPEVLLELPDGTRITRPAEGLVKRLWTEDEPRSFTFCVEYRDPADGARHEGRHIVIRPAALNPAASAQGLFG